MKLIDKVAVITGAAGGIGQAAAELFAREGAAVVLVDLDQQKLAQAAAAVGEHASDSSRISYIAADVTLPEDNQRMIDMAVKRYGGLDIFIANAGIEGEVAEIEDYSIEHFDRLVAVNVRGVWLGLKYAIPAMRARGGGSIVITSSGAGVKGVPKMIPYAMSKHAVVGIMRSAAIESAKYRVRVNTVNPGPVETRMMRSIEDGNAPGHGDAIKERLIEAVPLRRYAEPDEVARMMLFLASDDSSYCTGSVYLVDGGNAA